MPDSDFIKPLDVPAYISRPLTWNSLTPPRGNDINSRFGGIPPISQTPLVDPQPALNAGYYIDDTVDNGSNFGGYASLASGPIEAKFRSHISTSHFSRNDPIRNFGRPGTSHWHQFFGATNVHAFTTYGSLRNSQMSNSAGGPLNNTGYWAPAFLVDVAGKTYGKELDYAILYYSNGAATATGTEKIVSIPYGMRYVTGVNMDDPDDLIVKQAIANSNAVVGYEAWGYKQNGFSGYRMYSINANGSTGPLINSDYGEVSPCLKNLDGSDPWGGRATGGQLSIQMFGPIFIDGYNLWSPGGYKHTSHGARALGRGEYAANPDNWWQIPALTLTLWYSHGGFADYGRWRLSSDDMMQTKVGRAVPNGSSMHVDWMDGWNQTIRNTWEKNGMGIGGFEMHEMGDSRISNTRSLMLHSPSPDGRRTPTQVSFPSRGSTPGNGLVLLGNGTPSGPGTQLHKGS